MTTSEFRMYGRQVVDWIADYYNHIEERSVHARVRPNEIRDGLPEEIPQQGVSFESLMADIDCLVLPGITHWQHPRFFGYFPANASFPSILGELLSAGLGVQGMSWITSPVATDLERLMLDWLAQLLDLPQSFRSDEPGGGVIQDSASSAVLVALVAGLNRASGGTASRHGVGNSNYTVYASKEAHSSVEKAVQIAGVGGQNLRLVPTSSGTLAMRSDLLEAAIRSDIAAGMAPALVVGTVGTTSTTAVDPIREIGQICKETGVWLHVDAAYAGVAACCPEFRWLNEGVDLADSYCTNPHKWFLTNFDCDAFWVADRRDMINALSVMPEYLKNMATESGEVTDYRDWQIPLGRRFRALKLWFTLSWYGAQGLQAHIRHHVALAQEFASWVGSDNRFEVVSAHPLSLVCFRACGDDAVNERLYRRLNETGRIFVSHTIVDGRFVIRMAIGGTLTERRHVREAWELIKDCFGK